MLFGDFRSPFLYVNARCWIAYRFFHASEGVSVSPFSSLPYSSSMSPLFSHLVSTCWTACRMSYGENSVRSLTSRKLRVAFAVLYLEALDQTSAG